VPRFVLCDSAHKYVTYVCWSRLGAAHQLFLQYRCINLYRDCWNSQCPVPPSNHCGGRLRQVGAYTIWHHSVHKCVMLAPEHANTSTQSLHTCNRRDVGTIVKPRPTHLPVTARVLSLRYIGSQPQDVPSCGPPLPQATQYESKRYVYRWSVLQESGCFIWINHPPSRRMYPRQCRGKTRLLAVARSTRFVSAAMLRFRWKSSR